MRVCIIGGVLMISGHNILLGLFMVVGTTLVSLVEYKQFFAGVCVCCRFLSFNVGFLSVCLGV